MGHQHSEAGEVRAGAAGVCAIGGQETTVLRRPESHHGALGIAPERAVGIEVLFRMLESEEMETRQYEWREINQRTD